VKLVMFRAFAVVTIAVGVSEEDVDGKHDGAGCNRAYGGLRKTSLANKMLR